MLTFLTLCRLFDKNSDQFNEDSPIVGEVRDSKLPKGDDTFSFRLNCEGESQGLKLDVTLDKITSFAAPNLSSVAGTKYANSPPSPITALVSPPPPFGLPHLLCPFSSLQ